MKEEGNRSEIWERKTGNLPEEERGTAQPACNGGARSGGNPVGCDLLADGRALRVRHVSYGPPRASCMLREVSDLNARVGMLAL